MFTTKRHVWRGLATGLTAVLLVATVSACEPTDPSGPIRYQDAPIASYQVNGVGYATLIQKKRVYLGGTFTQVRTPGGVPVANRANVAAFDKYTGALVGGFRADTDGIVRTMAVAGNTLYLGGDFNSVNGVSRHRLAAVDLDTGAVLPWQADANSSIYSMAVGGSRLFVGGPFNLVRGVSRNRVAAVALSDGTLDTAFDPNANNTVNAVGASADGSHVYIGGGYSTVGGTPTTYLTALDPGNGAVVGPTFDASGVALDIEVSADGTRLVAGLGDYANQGAVFSTSSGARLNRQRCGGDAQAVAIVGTTYFSGFHEECDGDYTLRLTSNSLIDGTRDTTWKPAFDRFWGVRGLDGDAEVLAVAGDFTSVGGVPAQGIAIFSSKPPPPPGPVTLNRGSTWRYLDTGTEAPGWADPSFDDSTWATGAAELGYGDGDEATVVSYGPDAAHKYVTTWFRTSFEASAVPGTLTLDLVADDGAIVYLNGVEVQRDNVGAGTDSATLLAASNRSGSTESQVRTFTIPPELVQVGTNVIAVSVHQDWEASSDLSFDAALRSTAAG